MSDQIERDSWHDKTQLLKTIDKKLYAARTLQQEARVFINHLNLYHKDEITRDEMAKVGRQSSEIALISACINNVVSDMLDECIYVEEKTAC